MTGTVVVAGVSIAVGDLWLIGICWRHRAVLAGLLGASGIPLVVFAIASGPTIDRPEGTLAIALALLIVGVGLYGLGHVLERLLDEGSDEEV